MTKFKQGYFLNSGTLGAFIKFKDFFSKMSGPRCVALIKLLLKHSLFSFCVCSYDLFVVGGWCLTYNDQPECYWADGSHMVWNNFKTGHPTNSGHQMVVVKISEGYKWKSVDIMETTDMIAYVCDDTGDPGVWEN